MPEAKVTTVQAPPGTPTAAVPPDVPGVAPQTEPLDWFIVDHKWSRKSPPRANPPPLVMWVRDPANAPAAAAALQQRDAADVLFPCIIIKCEAREAFIDACVQLAPPGPDDDPDEVRSNVDVRLRPYSGEYGWDFLFDEGRGARDRAEEPVVRYDGAKFVPASTYKAIADQHVLPVAVDRLYRWLRDRHDDRSHDCEAFPSERAVKEFLKAGGFLEPALAPRSLPAIELEPTTPRRAPGTAKAATTEITVEIAALMVFKTYFKGGKGTITPSGKVICKQMRALGAKGHDKTLRDAYYAVQAYLDEHGILPE